MLIGLNLLLLYYPTINFIVIESSKEEEVHQPIVVVLLYPVPSLLLWTSQQCYRSLGVYIVALVNVV